VTDRLETYLDGLDSDVLRHPLVHDTVVAFREMDLDRTRQRLLDHSLVKRAKPYLHALETEKLRNISYDEIVEDIGSIGPKLGTVYFHVPFCVKKCSHCHYYKEIGVADDTIETFPAYLVKELSKVLDKFGRNNISARSVHYGGGTPSLLTINQWEELFRRLDQLLLVEPDDEVTIECSPEDITREKVAFWRSKGINRISLGIQSFDDDTLSILRRNHNAALSEQSYTFTLEAGFENINVDLMYGMPGRTLVSWLSDVQKILALRPESVTIYATRPDPADSLEKFDHFPGDGERIFSHLLALNAFLSAGYIQYSPNQFILSYKGACTAKRERNRCHNVLGIGPQAHSIMKNWFYFNKANLNAYLATLDKGELSQLKGARMSLEEEKVRYIQFGIKLSGINKPDTDNGVMKDGFEESFNETLDERFGEKIAYLEDQDLIATEDNNIHLTKKGILLNRDVVRYFGAAR
jgi:oxygen-independent coproporphyrinogen-3 oxidase